MTKLHADEYAVLIAAKLHALASSVTCGASTKVSFNSAMIRIAHLADAYEAARAADAEKRKIKIRPLPIPGQNWASGLNQTSRLNQK